MMEGDAGVGVKFFKLGTAGAQDSYQPAVSCLFNRGDLSGPAYAAGVNGARRFQSTRHWLAEGAMTDRPHSES